MNIIYVGMDVHKETYTFCAKMAEFGKKTIVLETKQVPASAQEVLKFVKHLQEKYGEDVKIECGYEAGCL